MPFRTAQDYDNYLARLELVPDRMKSYGEISLKAAREGYVQPCVTMTNFASTITGNITPDIAKSRFYAPFTAQRPEGIAADEWANLQARAKSVITTKVNPSYQAFADLYDRDLKNKCRQSVGVSAMPQGPEYYAFQVRQQTTTNLTPDEIHQIGQREVARIRAEMEQVASKAGFASREAMIADMRSNPKWFTKTPEELLEASAHDGQDHRRQDAEPVRSAGAAALWNSPDGCGDGAGGHDCSLPTGKSAGGPRRLLSGQYNQARPAALVGNSGADGARGGARPSSCRLRLQQELEMPDWRRNTAFFTAFVEGWGLYSERLGIEMGLYDTPQKDMGRLGL